MARSTCSQVPINGSSIKYLRKKNLTLESIDGDGFSKHSLAKVIKFR